MTWWIVATEPSQERRAVEGFGDLGFETWLPIEAYEFKNSRMPHAEWRYRLMYRGYVFVDISDWPESEAWHLVRSCDGVIRPLMCSGEARVFHFTDAEFCAFAAGFVSEIVPLVDDSWNVGDAFRVTDGAFQSLESRISAVLRRDRVRAEFNLMGRQTPVEFDVRQLERV